MFCRLYPVVLHSIDKSNLSAEPMSVELKQSSENVSTTHFVPRYVFLDNDKRSLIVKADTIGPQYHLALKEENVKSCHDLIDIAYLNDMEVEFRYDKSSKEVNSVKLLGRKAGKRSNTPIFTTEWVQSFKTNMKTYTLKHVYVDQVLQDDNKPYLLVGSFLPRYYNLKRDTPQFPICREILERAKEKFLFVDMEIAGDDSHEIVAVRFSSAIWQTFWRTSWRPHTRVGVLPTECSVLSEEELKQVYRRIIENSCDNEQRPDRYPCIPFGYAKDGCFARAHAMRRLINMMGFECNKVFLYGALKTKGMQNA